MHHIISIHILETERLLLKALGPAEIEQVYTTLADDEIKQFMGYTDAELQVERAKYNAGLTMHNRTFCNFLLVSKASGEVIGKCGFHTWMPMHSRAEIGYHMHSDELKGKGYMKEAFRPIIAYGFENMDLNRIEAFIGTQNQASQRLVKGAGFQQEGVLRGHYCKNGIIEDSLCFGLLKSDWVANL